MALATANEVRRRVAQGARASGFSQPLLKRLQAPVDGLNGRDDLASMKPTHARTLYNWFPGQGRVSVRGGTALHGTVGSGSFTAAAGSVETLAAFNTGTTTKLLAAADGKFWDATAGGNMPTALDTGFTNDRWSHANMLNKITFVNGADAPQSYDGTTWGDLTIAEIAGGPLAVSTLVGVHVFKSRSYWWAVNSQDFYYSAVNALGGDITKFPLGDVGNFGGHLVAMITWTKDGGSGMDDLAVFVMSSGEAIVYAGSNPGDADAWALVGVFDIGAPVGPRAIAKLGGDVLIAAADGYSLLSQVLPGARGAPGISVSDNLGSIALDQIASTPMHFGWDMLHYPGGRMVMINYPTHGGKFEQHVANLATGAWTTFRDMEAHCWALYNDKPYYGTASGAIIRADTGINDRGSDIIAVADQAYSDLGRVSNKHVTMVRPTLEATGAVRFQIGLSVDFNPRPETVVDTVLGVSSAAGAQWNVTAWNSAPWATAPKTAQRWIPHAARGFVIAPYLRVAQGTDAVSWSGTTIAFEQAGII